MNQDNLIEIRDLSVEFVTGEHSHRVVNNVSFDIKRGEIGQLVERMPVMGYRSWGRPWRWAGYGGT